MKLLALIIMGLFSLGNSLSAQTAERNRKILVAYFSCTGTTEKVAEAIANESGGKLYKITPAEAYTSADLDWQNKKSRSSVEMADEKSRPALGGEIIDLKDYDMVFLGYTLSGGTCVPIRSIHSLKSMIFRARRLFHLPLPVAVR